MSSSTATVSQPTLSSADVRSGVLTGLGCYVFWGLCPIFWKLLDHVNPFEVIANRVVWALVFMLLVCRVLKLDYVGLLRNRRALKYLGLAGIVVTFNWSVYIYAIATDHLVESALGYYINPLCSILCGMLFFKERLSKPQLAATALMCVGVLYFTLSYGQVPWYALLLAVSFAVYGTIKKKGGYPAIEAIAVENTFAAPIALVIGTVAALTSGTHAFLAEPTSLASWGTSALLMLAGPVTAIPLVLFGKAANKIPLSMLGFLQYLSPTISLLLGVFAYGEAFTTAHLVCFGCIWAGLALVSIEAVRGSRGK